MKEKKIFMLLTIRWYLIHERTRNFKDHVDATRPQTLEPVVIKLCKNQIWSENHETCQDVMIACGEAMIKIWQGFVKVVTYYTHKLKQLQTSFYISCEDWLGLSIVPDKLSRNLFKFLLQFSNMILWHLDKFQIFLIKFVFYIISKHLTHKFVVMFREQGV